MVNEQRDMKIPSSLIPLCPICKKPMTMNLRSDDKFVEDEGWHKACAEYDKFVAENKDKKALFIELGVGFNTPSIIKYPFWSMVMRNKEAFFACLNIAPYVPEEIEERSVGIASDINAVLKYLIS